MATKRSLKVLACTDKFKDSLGAQHVGDVVLRTLSKHFKQIVTHNLPLSDGGDGFVQAISLASSTNNARRMHINQTTVTGPLGQPITSDYGLVTSGTEDPFAVIEMAKTSGLELVPNEKRNPHNTTTKGLGELISKLYKTHSVRKVLMGIGGSATNDAGLGALQALGVTVTCKGGLVPETVYGRHLLELESINVSPLKEYHDLHIDIACDVNNPFIGKDGAVHTFGKQKGLVTQEMRDSMESGMIHTAKVLRDATNIEVSNMSGAGAAGGISGGFYAAFNAEKQGRVVLKRGIEVIAEYVQLEKHISESSLVITGEGCYDEQTAQGKVVSWVEHLCKRHNVPCVVVCGKSLVQSEPSDMHRVLELMSMFEYEESMNNTEKCLEAIIEKHLSYFKNLE